MTAARRSGFAWLELLLVLAGEALIWCLFFRSIWKAVTLVWQMLRLTFVLVYP